MTHPNASLPTTTRRDALRGGFVLLMGGLLAAAPAAAASRKKKAKARRGQAKVIPGSGETTAERERRLYRECQGRPNAGACEGYAR